MNHTEEWDAVVVGAGPAGSVTAREMARHGGRVLLVDRAKFPRQKVCGCCLNRATLAALDAVGLGHIPSECGAVQLNRIRLAAGKSNAIVALPEGVALSREEFDTALVNEAVKAGVTFRYGENITLTSGRVYPGRTHVTVLATGLAGNTARPERGSRIGAGVIVSASLAPSFYESGTIYMATGRGGYVGLVRLEDDRLDIAAAFDPDFVRNTGGPGHAAATILKEACWPIVEGIDELAWKGTPPLTRTPDAVAGDRWFAVGDAAGYVEPFTGEGMAWAVMSAAALAPIAVRAAAGWDLRIAREWTRTHHRLVGKRQRTCRWVARGLRSLLLTKLAVRALSFAPLLSRPLVAALNRPAQLPHVESA